MRTDAILKGSLWKSVPLFALPVAATGILEQLSNLVDVFVIGHFSTAGASLGMAAVGANSPIVSLLVNLFVGIAIGTNVVVANAVGAGDEKTVRRAVHSSVLLAAIGFVVALVGEVFAQPLLEALQVPDETMAEALIYLRIYLLGMPAVLLYNFVAAVFRSVGVTKMPLFALAISAVLNVVLDALFVAILGWGTMGVAVATVLCYCVSAAFLTAQLARADALIRLDPRELRIDGPVAREIIRIGMPAGAQGAIFSLANIVIQGCINQLGTTVMAGSAAALSMEQVFYNLINSVCQACTTFVGQCNGAGDLTRCRRVLKVCVVEGLTCTGLVALFSVIFGRAIIHVFNTDPEVIAIGYLRMCVILPAHLFSSVYENCSGYLRGFRISLVPAALTMLGVCGIRLLWVAFVFPAWPTFATIMAVYPISLGATALLMFGALVYFRPAEKALA
jgi:putative MATE family efflux protein